MQRKYVVFPSRRKATFDDTFNAAIVNISLVDLLGYGNSSEMPGEFTYLHDMYH